MVTEAKNEIPDSPQIYNTSSSDIGNSYTKISSDGGCEWILPVPIDLNYESFYQWNEEDTSFYTDVVSRIAPYSNGNLEGEDDAKKIATEVLKGIAGQSLSENAQRGFLKGYGLAYNPNKKLFFTGLNMREFSTVFSLSPISEEESNKIRAGFSALSKRSAPEYAFGGGFFTYPDLFSLCVKVNGSTIIERKKLAIIRTVLEFTSDGPLTWHSDGFPTTLRATIAFKESVIPTRDALSNITVLGRPLG